MQCERIEEERKAEQHERTITEPYQLLHGRSVASGGRQDKGEYLDPPSILGCLVGHFAPPYAARQRMAGQDRRERNEEA